MTRAFSTVGTVTDPTIDELQQMCLDEVLPRITTCLARLAKVTADQDFTFIVTPKMQGDEGEDPVELDLTEVYATMAGLSALRAGLLHFTAYDFNLDAYTGEEMRAALTPGSSFGTLHPEGDGRMQSALEAWRNAVLHLQSAVDFLESETDPQGDDLIYVDPYDDFTQADLDSIKRYLPIADNILHTSDGIKANWDDDSHTPDERVEFSLNSFYSTPVQDLKGLLPAYACSLDITAVDTRQVYEDSVVSANVTLSDTTYYAWQREAAFSDGEMGWYWERTDMDVPEWDAAWDALVAKAMDKDWAYVSAYFYSYLEAGEQTIQCTMYIYYDEAIRSRYIPVIIWEADTFEDWILPDPTFGGLLPGMTDARLKEIVGFDEEDWEKTEELDFWDW
jgi:hypothetical protein